MIAILTRYANDTLLGYIKPYITQNNDGERIYYTECEWRYIVTEMNGIKWKRGEKYDEWRGDSNNPKPKVLKEVLKKEQTFAVDDIIYLITNTEEDSMKLLQDIQKLKKIRGKDISDLDRYKLVNKIISFEKI